MDDPSIDPAEHRRALRALDRIHRVTGTTRIVAHHVAKLTRNLPTDPPITLLDVACGGGALGIQLARRLNHSAHSTHLVGLDASQVALDTAAEQANRHSITARWTQGDAIAEPLPPCDVAVCALFLHHLDEPAAVALLANMAAARLGFVLIDLLRSRRGLLLAQLGTRLITASPTVHADGPQSVRAAFTRDEMRDLARQAGLTDDRLTITPVLSQRAVIRWAAPARVSA